MSVRAYRIKKERILEGYSSFNLWNSPSLLDDILALPNTTSRLDEGGGDITVMKDELQEYLNTAKIDSDIKKWLQRDIDESESFYIQYECY